VIHYPITQLVFIICNTNIYIHIILQNYVLNIYIYFFLY